MKVIKSIRFYLMLSLCTTLVITSCSNEQPVQKQEKVERTAHLLSLKFTGDLRVGSRVVNEDGDTVGVVKELISDSYGERQLIEIEKSYLKYPAAEFKISIDSEGQICLLAYY